MKSRGVYTDLFSSFVTVLAWALSLAGAVSLVRVLI